MNTEKEKHQKQQTSLQVDPADTQFFTTEILNTIDTEGLTTRPPSLLRDIVSPAQTASLSGDLSDALE